MLRRDSTQMKHLQNNKITKFLLISFLISWGFGWGLLAFLTQMSLLSLTTPLGVFLHLLGGFGPTIAAISCLPQKSIKSIVSFILGDSKKYILLFLLLIFVQTGVIAFSSKELNLDFPLGNLFVVFLSAVCVYGGEEELGWRGTLQPTLETRFSFWIFSLITGCIWVIWHVPLWFVIGSSQSGIPFILFSLFAIYLSILLAAVFKKTKSVLYCAIFHGLINTLLSLFVIKINFSIISGLVILLVWAHFL